jgi:thiol-disulfide isomerase/thioredoxin
MLRNVLLSLALLSLLGVWSIGDETKAKDKADTPKKEAKKEPEKKEVAKPKITLKVGDPAPELKVSKWLRGDEVKSFEKDKIYVVEFWATWCGPCIVMMPHLADLQDEYKAKGVTFIGFTTTNPRNNSEEKVTTFVEKRKKLTYTFAMSDNSDTNTAWMQASGQRGIPCCFVVDQKGNIAYIGHPMLLDEVLPKVVAGEWKYEKAAEFKKEIEDEMDPVWDSMRNPKKFLEAVESFEQKHPKLNKIPYFFGGKLAGLIAAERTVDLRKFAKEALESAKKRDDDRTPMIIKAAAQKAEGKVQEVLEEVLEKFEKSEKSDKAEPEKK